MEFSPAAWVRNDADSGLHGGTGEAARRITVAAAQGGPEGTMGSTNWCIVTIITAVSRWNG